jgi:hypothetical protein
VTHPTNDGLFIVVQNALKRNKGQDSQYRQKIPKKINSWLGKKFGLIALRKVEFFDRMVSSQALSTLELGFRSIIRLLWLNYV